MAAGLEIVALGPDDLPDALGDLAEILRACVEDGASVGFLQPLDREAARDWWESEVAPAVASGAVVLWVARIAGRVAGTVQLVPSAKPSHTHRADVVKLMVHPQARGHGLGRALMRAVEAGARDRGRSLLVLDTRTPDDAEHLYRSLGWVDAGTIPGYAQRPDDPEARDATLFMYRILD